MKSKRPRKVKTKKHRKKKTYNLKTRITSALRKIWFYSPFRREAVARAKANGNKCEKCGEFQEKLEIDHKNPVASLDGKDDDWNGRISRMFCDSSELLAICTPCHKAKTQIARVTRKQNSE